MSNKTDGDFTVNNEGEYLFNVFYHNGEPLRNSSVNITLFNHNLSRTSALFTDNNGVVNLGCLLNV